MGALGRYDFHVHSSASDGQDSPWETIKLAQKRGLDAIALTDHNTLSSAMFCVAYERHLERTGKACTHAVPGIEVSSYLSVGGATDIVHLIGLDIDPLDSSLVSLCSALDTHRESEREAAIEHARALGYAIGKEAEARVARSFWGRGALARELVLEAQFDVVDEAYHAVFDPEFLRSSNLRQCVPAELAVEAIHSAGGWCVLAHPYRNELSHGHVSRSHVIERLRGLDALDIDGLETYYSAFSLEECLWLEGLAKARGMLTSVGSDHHDTKRRDRLGTCCSDGGNHGDHASIVEVLGVG